MEFPAPPYDAGDLSVRFHAPAGEEEESVRVSQTQPRKHSKFTSVFGSESFDFDFTSELFAAPENPEPESPAIYLSAIEKISLKGPTQAKPIRAFNENEFCPMPPTKSSYQPDSLVDGLHSPLAMGLRVQPSREKFDDENKIGGSFINFLQQGDNEDKEEDPHDVLRNGNTANGSLNPLFPGVRPSYRRPYQNSPPIIIPTAQHYQEVGLPAPLPVDCVPPLDIDTSGQDRSDLVSGRPHVSDDQKEESTSIKESVAPHYAILNRYLTEKRQNPKKIPKMSRARDKLLRLSSVQFQELSTDVYDELLRRQALTSAEGNDTHSGLSYLLPKENFHPKRNQARQKLSTLPSSRFPDLATDVISELERRFPNLAAKDSPRGSPALVIQSESKEQEKLTSKPNNWDAKIDGVRKFWEFPGMTTSKPMVLSDYGRRFQANGVNNEEILGLPLAGVQIAEDLGLGTLYPSQLNRCGSAPFFLSRLGAESSVETTTNTYKSLASIIPKSTVPSSVPNVKGSIESTPKDAIVQERVVNEMMPLSASREPFLKAAEADARLKAQSMYSVDSMATLTPDQKQMLITRFTRALLKHLPNRLLLTHRSTESRVPFQQRFQSLLCDYSDSIKKDAGERSHRQATKQIRVLRRSISQTCEEALEGDETTATDQRVYPNIIKEMEKFKLPEKTWEEKFGDWSQSLPAIEPTLASQISLAQEHLYACPSRNNSMSQDASESFSAVTSLNLSDLDDGDIRVDGGASQALGKEAGENGTIYEFMTTHNAFHLLLFNTQKLIERHYSN